MSTREATALRTKLLLRDGHKDWCCAGQHPDGDEQEKEDERVAKETFDMLSELLKNNKESN